MKHLAISLSIALILTGCGGSDSDSADENNNSGGNDSSSGEVITPTALPTATPDPIEDNAEVLKKDDHLAIANSEDYSGYALYVRDDESSDCDSQCMQGYTAIPLYDGTPSGYIRLDSVNDTNGTPHITYNSKTLYRFDGDTSADSTNGVGNGWSLAKVFTIVGDCTLDDNEKILLERHNIARATPRSCGGDVLPAVADLRWDCNLAAAAKVHSTDMATHDHFSHEGTDKSTFTDRMTAAGYTGYRTAGENIYAATNSTADNAVDGWIDSPGHCANIMNGGFEDMGGAVIENSNFLLHRYWTVDFGTRW